MTDEEMNLICARELEPDPKWKDLDHHWLLSDGKCWNGRHSSNGVLEQKRPQDFLDSESANAMLRDSMLKQMSIVDWAYKIALIADKSGIPVFGVTVEQFRAFQVQSFIEWRKR